ncbi:MAG: hypothetical protein Fur006_05330 [Coleofasciculaceae cyanobacterium]
MFNGLNRFNFFGFVDLPKQNGERDRGYNTDDSDDNEQFNQGHTLMAIASPG